MSVENKIKELLSRSSEKQQLTEGEIVTAATKAAAATSKDTSKAAQAAVAGDTTQPKQGSSQDASFTTHDEDEENPGAKASAGISMAGLPSSKGDAKSVKMAAMEEVELNNEEQENISNQLNLIFGEELSEEFKTKATSIFEAAVIARVNSEMEKITSKLEEQSANQLLEFKEILVEKVDSYLNYVVDQWMEENQLAVDTGLRTEITEDFITGLKKLFTEHYIEVPEEKYEVLDELQTKSEELQAMLDNVIGENVELARELSNLKAEMILDEQTKGLAATEAEKLKKLVEGVNFDSEELYREKVTVIKENYFPKAAKISPEEILVEESNARGATFDTNDTMSKYVQSISRTIKNR